MVFRDWERLVSQDNAVVPRIEACLGILAGGQIVRCQCERRDDNCLRNL